MTVFERASTIIRFRDNRSKMLAGGAALALLAGAGGLLIGRGMAPEPAATVQEAAPNAGEQGAEAAAPDAVTMTPAQISASQIAVEAVAPGSLLSEIIAPASVTAPPEGQAIIAARADGAVARINKRLGDVVGAGDTLALMESREAAAFVSERNAAAAKATAARNAAAREQRLFNAKVTARETLEAAVAEARTADAELQRAEAAIRTAGVVGNGRYLAVRSPISGRVTEVDTQLGAYVSAGTELFNVSNPNRIQINASVPVPQAQMLQPGDAAKIELPIGGTVDAVVRSISPSADRETRSISVVLQVTGAPGGLRQGQAVRARMTPRNSKASGIVLPEEAVQQVEGRDVVFLRTRDGFRAQPVSIGQRSGGRVEIISGLKAGQQVATTNVFQLKAELAKGAGEEE